MRWVLIALLLACESYGQTQQAWELSRKQVSAKWLGRELVRVRGYAAKPTPEEWAYVHLVLDRLIQARASVPAELLRPFAKEWTTEVLILLSRAPDPVGVLLAMDREGLDDPQWLARSNILLQHSPRELELELGGAVDVPGRLHLSVQSYRLRPFPKNFPANRIYLLEGGNLSGGEEVIPGPKPVKIEWEVAPSGTDSIPTCTRWTPSRPDRVLYRAAVEAVTAPH